MESEINYNYNYTLERFHIHTEVAANNHLNENQTIFPNVIFDTLTETHRP